MYKYAMVIDGLVRSVFYSEFSASAYPDIAQYLYVVQDPVDSNWTWDGTSYWSQDGSQSWTPQGD